MESSLPSEPNERDPGSSSWSEPNTGTALTMKYPKMQERQVKTETEMPYEEIINPYESKLWRNKIQG